MNVGDLNAEVLEMTQSNVKVSLHRARAALKKLLEPVIWHTKTTVLSRPK